MSDRMQLAVLEVDREVGRGVSWTGDPQCMRRSQPTDWNEKGSSTSVPIILQEVDGLRHSTT